MSFKNRKKLLLIIIPIIYVLFELLILIDLVFISLKPWSYASGAKFEYIRLSESLFWEQWEYHCLYFQIKPPYMVLLLIWSVIVGIISESFIKEKLEHSENSSKTNLLLVQEFSLLAISVVISGLIYTIWNQKVGGVFINGSVLYIMVLLNLNIVMAIVLVRPRPRWLTLLRLPLLLIFVLFIFVIFFTQGCI